MRNLALALGSLAFLPCLALAHGGVDDGELIVRMTAEGFAPQELTVTQNDVVLFINNDDVPRAPYYEQDGGKEAAPGSSVKLAFPEAGSFRVRDAKNANAKLTVVSLEDPANRPLEGETPSLWQRLKHLFLDIFRAKKAEAKLDQKLLAEFKGLSVVEKYAWVNKVGAEEGAETAWRYVIAAYTTPDGVVGDAHDLAHLVGQLLYKQYGFKGLATCTPTFAFGCYHGVMQVAFDREKPAEFPAQLAAARAGCEGVAEETSPSYWSCIHGVGHGVATYENFDLSQALADCDTYGERFATYCHDGVFMEFVARAPESYYKTSDPIYPCDAIDGAYRVACARNQVQAMKQKFGMADAAIAKACLASGDKDISYHCIDAIGYGVGQSARGDAKRAIAECRAIADEAAAAQCLAAAAGELVFQDAAGWQKSAETICGSLAGGAREACEARVASVKQSYGR
jgi:hypothetical protein